ncbi:MAG: macro domain-containing protein [Elusimicrobia bacterium]|nr:macro domain-containing protein [Elusimicrobiota bacterium]
MSEKRIKNTMVRLVKGDVTAREVDAFVFYARPDLQLGSGHGTAIAVRGGAAVKKELDKIGGAKTGQAVVTGAGQMKAKYIIHAVGPRFQEPDQEQKLRQTMRSCLRQAEETNIAKLAFPAMGSGFYGVALPLCVKVMLEEIKKHLEGATGLEEVEIVVGDSRETAPFEEAIKKL